MVAAGGTHSLFIALSGLVYCCGANKLGQLGLNRVDEKGTYYNLFGDQAGGMHYMEGGTRAMVHVGDRVNLGGFIANCSL